jgi:hypothetical protein
MRTALFSLFSITCSETKISVVAGASDEVPDRALRVMLMFLTNDATNKNIERCRVKL